MWGLQEVTDHRAALIAHVWTWDQAAVDRKLPPEVRRGIWRVLDALYDDMPIVRTPGYRERLREVLAGMKQTEGVVAVRKELGL